MSIGFWTFIAGAVLGAVCAVISCRRAASLLSGTAARKYAAVLALSLVAYAGVCLWFGYGLTDQSLAVLAGCVPLWFGRRYVPSLDEMRGDH